MTILSYALNLLYFLEVMKLTAIASTNLASLRVQTYLEWRQFHLHSSQDAYKTDFQPHKKSRIHSSYHMSNNKITRSSFVLFHTTMILKCQNQILSGNNKNSNKRLPSCSNESSNRKAFPSFHLTT